MAEIVLQNCNNCGAPYEGKSCGYCGTGIAAVIRRIKQASTYVVAPKKKPAVTKIIEVCASNAAEMRKVSEQNAEAYKQSTCVAKIVKKIDAKVADAVKGGETSCQIGQIYIRCDKYEQAQIDKHYGGLGFRFRYDISWTNRNPPAWIMAKYDTVTLSW